MAEQIQAPSSKMRWIAVAFSVVALAGAIALVASLRALGDRSDRIEQLSSELEVVNGDLEQQRSEREDLGKEIDRVAAESAATESRWLASVAVSGEHSPSQSRLLAVEAASRSATAEAAAALGQLLFADARTDPPLVELSHDGPTWIAESASMTDLVATGSDDTTAKLWTTAGELVTTLTHTSRVRAVAFSADDRFVATGTSDGAVAAWTVDGEQVAVVQHADQLNDATISHDGSLLLSAGSDGVVLVTDTTTGEIKHELAHPDTVWTVAFSTDEERAVSGSEDGSARVWDLASGEVVATYDLGQPLTVVGFSPDGLWLFAGARRGEAFVVSTDEGEPISLDGPIRGSILDLDWHPAHTELAVVSNGGVNRYRLPTGEFIAGTNVAGSTRGAAYGPDGSWFVSGSGDFQYFFGEIAFWDSASGRKLLSVNLGGPVESVAVHPNGTVVASFRSSEDFVEVGGSRLLPGPESWITLACKGTDKTISEQTWSGLTGEPTSHRTDCP